MEQLFLLAVPRMHAEIAPLIPGCLTFWPGLPSMPASAWQPDLPWQGATAAACLTDFEQSVRAGARGTPVHAAGIGAGQSAGELSYAEITALEAFAGNGKAAAPDVFRQNAQQTLLLAWLMESQSIEIARLETDVCQKRASLFSIISNKKAQNFPFRAIDGSLLPNWRDVLAAMLVFLPDMPVSCSFFINDSDLAQGVLDQTGKGDREQAYAQAPLPCCTAVRMQVQQLAALCGRSRAKRLLIALPPKHHSRLLTIVVPDGAGRRQP